MLEVRETQLTHAIWRSPESSRYTTWSVKKRRGGHREIAAPCRTLKILQSKLAVIFELVAQRRSVSHGFTSGKSIVTNARVHVRARWILNVDLEDFFPTIHFGRVRGMLMAKPYQIGERAATAIAQLCCFQQELPQGAPTSPIVSNMICAKLDGELRRLAKTHGCRYSRYVDDITFSTWAVEFPKELAETVGSGSQAVVGPALNGIVQSNGFRVNSNKVRLQGRTERQVVTGLTVNRRPNVRKKYVSQLRSMIHAWERFGYEAAQDEFLEKYDTKHRPAGSTEDVFRLVVQGKLAFLKQVRGPDDRRYLALRRRVNVLLGVVESQHQEGLNMEFDTFICHASEDKARVVKPLVKAFTDAGIRVWIDEEEIGWGDGITAQVNRGLAKSKFVVLVLSSSFLKKQWPQKEMNAVMNQEISGGVLRALPLMADGGNVKEQVKAQYPLLADKLHMEWDPADSGRIVSALKRQLNKTSQ